MSALLQKVAFFGKNSTFTQGNSVSNGRVREFLVVLTVFV